MKKSGSYEILDLSSILLSQDSVLIISNRGTRKVIMLLDMFPSYAQSQCNIIHNYIRQL